MFCAGDGTDRSSRDACRPRACPSIPPLIAGVKISPTALVERAQAAFLGRLGADKDQPEVSLRVDEREREGLVRREVRGEDRGGDRRGDRRYHTACVSLVGFWLNAAVYPVGGDGVVFMSTVPWLSAPDRDRKKMRTSLGCQFGPSVRGIGSR
mgnify:CR=1 FL=1